MSRENRTIKDKICDVLSYIVISLLFSMARIIPIYIFSLFFGILAVILCPFIPTTYLVLRNLKENTDLNIFQRIITTFGVWFNLGSFAGEYPYIYKMKKNKIFDFVSIEEPEKIEKIKNNNGFIISGHLSNWEFGLRALHDLGIKNNVVFRKLNNQLLEPKYSARLRESVGIGTIAKQDNAAFKIVKALKKGENIVLLIDQRDTMNGVLIKFFKNEAYTIKTVYSMSKKLNIPVYGIRIIRTGFLKFILKIEELDTSIDNENEFLQNMNNMLERWIKEHMSQWFWVHDRWKK